MEKSKLNFNPDSRERIRRVLVQEQIAKFQERILLEMKARPPDEVPEMIVIETSFGYICEVRWFKDA